MKKLTLLLTLLAFLVQSGSVFAQGADPTPPPTPSDDEVNRIAKNMYCPVCENVPLDTCETKACKDWREEIRLKLSQGWTDQQIYDYFVEQHGDRVLAAPPPRGLNWLVYVVPPLALLAGVFFVYRLMNRSLAVRRTQPGSSGMAPESTPQADPELVSRLEKELKDRE